MALRDRLRGKAAVYYRHRAKNTNRKAGNIADFVTRWGGAYPQMVVLDADSLMTAHSVVNLAAAMEADPDAGIIQTLPLIINRNTLFARLQQFAARIHGPVIAAGLSVWMGRDGNYWGHNAIIRTQAFADHCGLPHLSRQAAVRRPHPQPRLRRGGADPPRRLGRLHAAGARRLLRGEPALPDRPRGARPALVPGQPAARARHVGQGLPPRLAAAFRHRHHGLCRLAAVDGAAAGRHRAGAAVDLHPARIFHAGLLAVPGLAAVRRAARPRPLRHHHGGAAGAEALRPAHRARSARYAARQRRRARADPVDAGRDRDVVAAGAHHDADPVGLGHADPARPRHGLEPAAPRRRLDPASATSCAATART